MYGRVGEGMEFRILGSLEIVDGTRAVPIRPGNDRALLALLLLQANEVVSSDRLIDELWGEAPPASATKIVHNAVSRLRRALGDERLETRGHGYLLHLAPDELDAARFERLVAGGNAREALALWRGPPLADLDGQRFAAAAAERLHALRLDALERRIDEDLADGRIAGLAAEIERLVATHPFRERLHAQLMRALYADGRQADALDAYRRARRTLSDELGLEPGPELQELERAILQQDPALLRVGRARPSRPLRVRRLVVALVVLAGAAIGATLLVTRDRHAVVVLPNSVVVIDPAHNRVIASIPVGAQPAAVAAGATGVWVASPTAGTVSRIDPRRLTVAKSWGVGGEPLDVTVDSRGAWVATGSDNTLVWIDAHTGIGRAIALPRGSHAGAYTVAVGYGALWTAGDTLLELDPVSGSVIGRGPPGCCLPSDIAVGYGYVWVANTTETVAKIGPKSLALVSTQNLGTAELQLALGYGSVWAVGIGSFGKSFPGVVWRLNPSNGQVSPAARVGQFPDAISIGADGIWVANLDDRTVSRLDPTTGHVVATIPVGRPPTDIAATSGRVWVSVR